MMMTKGQRRSRSKQAPKPRVFKAMDNRKCSTDPTAPPHTPQEGLSPPAWLGVDRSKHIGKASCFHHRRPPSLPLPAPPPRLPTSGTFCTRTGICTKSSAGWGGCGLGRNRPKLRAWASRQARHPSLWVFQLQPCHPHFLELPAAALPLRRVRQRSEARFHMPAAVLVPGPPHPFLRP